MEKHNTYEEEQAVQTASGMKAFYNGAQINENYAHRIMHQACLVQGVDPVELNAILERCTNADDEEAREEFHSITDIELI